MSTPQDDSPAERDARRRETAAERDARRIDSLDLDALLELDREVPVPRDLAARVLGGLRAREQRALDTLLEYAREGDALTLPPGLAERVLAAVRADEAYATGPRQRFTWLRGGALPRVAAAAVVLALAFGAWRASRSAGGDEHVAELARHGAGSGSVSPEVLEYLAVLERWDLLTGAALDGELSTDDLDTLAALDDEDELLLLLSAEENG